LAFINNYGDINEYYSSKYAVVSAIERWLNTRRSDGTLMTGKYITGYSYPTIWLDWSFNHKKLWTGEIDASGDILVISGYMWDYYDTTSFSKDENWSFSIN
jgi:hypothetical protein